MVSSTEPVIKEFLKILLPEMQRLFEVEDSRLEKCEVTNNHYLDAPMFCSISQNPHFSCHNIYLALQGCEYWCQVIYQLSHELTHYLLYLKKTDKLLLIKWIEETICESMSLYMLDYCVQNWSKCSFSGYDTNYNQCILQYLEDELLKEGTGELTLCKTIDQLREVDSLAQQNRDMRHNEVIKLYKTIKTYPNHIISLSNYTNYLLNENNLLLDSVKLSTDNLSDPVINYLFSLQPTIQ